MNLKKFTLATIITVLVLFLSSCSSRDDDRYYVTGEFDKKVTVYTNKFGEIQEIFRMSQADFYFNSGHNFRDIEDIRYRGGSIEFFVGNRGFIGDLAKYMTKI